MPSFRLVTMDAPTGLHAAAAGSSSGFPVGLGRSGSTGLAGGDHLHYSMQVDGVQVNPVEWWDDHWIHDRIRSKFTP